jgi:hypothetical protein
MSRIQIEYDGHTDQVHDAEIVDVGFRNSPFLEMRDESNRQYDGTIIFDITYSDFANQYFSRWMNIQSNTVFGGRPLAECQRKISMFGIDFYEGWIFNECTVQSAEVINVLTGNSIVTKLRIKVEFNYYTTPARGIVGRVTDHGTVELISYNTDYNRDCSSNLVHISGNQVVQGERIIPALNSSNRNNVLISNNGFEWTPVQNICTTDWVNERNVMVTESFKNMLNKLVDEIDG